LKYFLSALLTLLLVYSLSQTLRAQAPVSWVSVPLEGDQLTVLMPKNHKVKSREFSFGQFKVKGHVYTATEDGVDYSVWSLANEGDAMANLPNSVSYLDYCADLVWESILKSRRDQLLEEAKFKSRMSYASNLSWTKLQVNKVWHQPLGREYSIMLGNRPGKTQFYVAGRQIYILIVLNEDANVAAAQHFVNSFRTEKHVDPKRPLSGIGPGRGGNIGGGDHSIEAADTDYNRVFSGKEVTQKARILSKPEPEYTESARKYSVQGTVIVLAVFSRSGEVTKNMS